MCVDVSKLALFVEGQAELVFVEKLLIELAGFHRISIERQVMHGGRVTHLSPRGTKDGKFVALLVNCECDGKVKSAIQERRSALKDQGYRWILGLRDLRPEFKLNELGKASVGIRYGLDDDLAVIDVIFAVQELEAWFLKETSHFMRISAALTPPVVRQVARVDLDVIRIESVSNPAVTLDRIYRAGGASYGKSLGDVNRVVAALDFDSICIDMRDEIEGLKELIGYFDLFLVDE